MESIFDRPSPFDALSVRPAEGDTYTDDFGRLCEISYGMSVEGARRHFETLSHIPEGHTYHGKWQKELMGTWTGRDVEVVALDCPAYDIDGNQMEGYVVLAKVPDTVQ